MLNPPLRKGTQEFFCTAEDGTRLYVEWVRRRGEGPIALLADGLVCDGFIYKYLREHLLEHVDIAHFHYRGHGRSEAPHDATQIDVTALARDLVSVHRALGSAEIILIGHSLGTQVALEAYGMLPGAVRALVLMCGSFGRVTHTFKGSDLLANVLPDLIQWVSQHRRIAQALWSRIPVKTALRVASLLGDINLRAVRIDDVAPYFQHVVHVDFELFLRMLRLAGEHSAEAMLDQVSVPALVVAGRRDTIVPPEVSRTLADRLPQGRLCTIAQGTHLAPLEAHEEVAREIRLFLDETGILA